MKNRAIRTTLNEDFEKLGIPGFNVQEQVVLSGGTLTEDMDEANEEMAKCPKCGKEYCSKCDEFAKSGKCPNCGAKIDADGDGEQDDDGEDDVEENFDPLEAPIVNDELFDAILGLDLDELQVEDIEEILSELEKKELPRDEDGNVLDEELGKRAESIVNILFEAVATRTRRSKAGSMAKKASFQCPEGTRRVPGTRRCVRAAQAAGGAGKLAKEKREKRKWGKSGKGKLSGRKSARWAARREGDEEQMSEFARELFGLIEGDEVSESTLTLRDEIIGRLGDLLEMLSEEFEDEAVTRLFEDKYEAVVASMDAGRLDEAVMSDEEFLGEIHPILTLANKSLSKICDMEEGGLGNG